MNEITKIPLVDILSKQLNKTIVMRDTDYVELGTDYVVSQVDIDTALLEQDRLYNEEYTKAINNAIQVHLDTQAQALRYDNINSIGKYVGYVNDFQAEAEALGAWASSCWTVAGQIEADVQAGLRSIPTVDEVIAELPVYGG